jgi:hypothetical protein
MATAHARAQTLGVSCSIQGVQLQAGTQVFLGLSNELVLCVLPEPQRIQGIPCARGLVHFHPDATLAQATLARDHVERGVPFAAGTQLSWNEDGTLGAALKSPQVIAGVPMPADATVRFDAAGMLLSWSRRVNGATVVGGIPCEDSAMVTFHATGEVERLTLGQSFEIGDITALGGTDLELHLGGGLAVATLGASWTHDGITFEVGTQLTFRPDGTLSIAILAEDHARGDERWPEGSQLYFDEAGHLSGHAALTWEVLRPART